MKPKVLIVDDYEPNILALRDTISELDINIDSATSGRDALGMVLENDYAIILMDVNMPEMDGFETVELIKSKERTKYIPIIFVTAVNTNKVSESMGYDTGAVDYLYKPLDPNIVVSKVKVFIDLYQQKNEIQVLNSQLSSLNKSLEEFSHLTSHDLQEPLRTISYYSSMLKEQLKGKIDEKSSDILDNITSTSIRMGYLIKDLLNYSKCDWEFIQEEIDINSCIQDSIKALKTKIEGSKAKIIVPNLPSIMGARVMITQLFQNLIGNAIKFSDQDNPAIEITHRVECGIDIFGVKDNGIGFDKKLAELAFKPFKRLPNVSNKEGTGIGLSTCKKIVEKHNGMIWVDTREGEGAHFQFTLQESEILKADCA